MATFDYNPITGQLDLVGGGASYIDGVVDNSSLLPVTLGTPALDSVFLAKAGSGLWLISRRPAGLYVRVANNGVAADWTYLGAFPEVNSSANWSLYDGTTPSKELKFDLSAISNSTVRTLTAPDASGRIQVEGQPIGNTTPAAGTFTTLTANNGTLTASAPVLNLAQTWNASGTTFTGLSLAITNTASASASAYLSFALDGTQAFSIRRGETNANATIITCGGAGGLTWTARTRTGSGVGVNFSGIIGVGGSLQFGTGTGASGGDVILIRDDAANTLAQRRDTNAQTFNIYNTFTSATNFERLRLAWASNVAIIGTEKGSGGGTARALEFQTDGTTRMTIASTGAATFAGGLSSVGINASGGSISTNQTLSLSGTNMSCVAVFGTLDITTNAAGLRLYGLGSSAGGGATNTERLHISTRSGASYFISTQATGTGTARALEIRTADVARLTFEAAGGLTIADANDIAVGTTTGTKIGTSTTQKIGFFNATPVVQQAAVADATDAASTQARLNDLLARLRTLGLIAT